MTDASTASNELAKATASHELAKAAAEAIIKGCVAADLKWSDSLITVETTIAIVIGYVVMSEGGPPDKVRYADALIDTLARRAKDRVAAIIQGVPYAG